MAGNPLEIYGIARRIVDPTEREAFLDRACADDEAVRERVAAMLHIEDVPQSFLGSPIVLAPSTDEPGDSAPGSRRPTVGSPSGRPPMSTSVAEFVKAAAGSGILTADVLAEYVQGVAPDSDAAALASRLVKAGRLTPFQAKHIYGGRANALVLGPYVVLDLLGKGGMGSVFKAEHRKMRRVVALKVIAKTALKSPAAVQRFEREVQAAARLEHPNIVTAFDAGEAGGTHYLVMQFVDGRNLMEVVRAVGPLPLGRAVDWVLQAAQGLAYAHGKGVVHRDIKPGNLLVDHENAIKILDMGLARLETLDADQDQLTGTGQIMGTVDYMAPEQAMDTRRADARSDIYSLGVTLWYLLAGRPLFEADSMVKKIMAHQQTPPPPLTSVRGDIPPQVEVVFQRMVAKNPGDRFPSMQEVITALRSLPQSERGAGPPSIACGAGQSVPGALGTDDTQKLEHPQAVVVDEDTARPSAVDIDTDLELKKSVPKPGRGVGGPQPLHLAIGGGTVGALVLIGLLAVIFGGRRAATPALRTDPDSTASSPTARSSRPPAPAVAPFDATQARRHQEAWAEHLGLEVETTNSIGQVLVVIPPGWFTMGEGDTSVDVTLTTPFLLGQTEVTQGQWKEVMGSQSPSTWQDDDRPVEQVSWEDALAFCRKLSARPEERQAGRVYRLPTEAEWEYACRAGTTDTYSFDGAESRLGDYGWFKGNSDQQTHCVLEKKPNQWGLHDMHGNVWEWCSDLYGDDPRLPGVDPLGASEGVARVTRGGGWDSPAADCRGAGRLKANPAFHHYALGFRVALSPSAVELPAVPPGKQVSE